MNRKLHNSLIASLTSGMVLAVILLAAAPADSSPAQPSSLMANGPTQPAQTDAPARRAAMRLTQSVRMPFFSFSPRS